MSSRKNNSPNATFREAFPKATTPRTEASQKNGRKSKGPKTPRGKSHSRLNATKHGLYSKELLISDSDKPDFELLCVSLKAQLKPSTYLLELEFDYVLCCAWRRMCAMRLEHRQFEREFKPETEDNSPPEGSAQGGVLRRWYGQSLTDLRSGIRLIKQSCEEFQNLGHFSDETKASLKRGFGEDFLTLLEHWEPSISLDAILLGHHLSRHRQSFGPRKELDLTEDTLKDRHAVIIDPMQNRNMVLKLLEERGNFLLELGTIIRGAMRDELPSATANRSFNTRLIADVTREFRRSLESYLKLKEEDL
jgi:hypothetical protein